jgi:hypothetical protein
MKHIQEKCEELLSILLASAHQLMRIVRRNMILHEVHISLEFSGVQVDTLSLLFQTKDA